MFRTSDVILIAVMLSAAAFTYKTKHDAQAMMNQIGQLETQIELEKDRIDVLKADWSLLTQPGRLSKLAEAYEEELGLGHVEPKQIVNHAALRQIPFRGESIETIIAESVDMQERVLDPTVTGGVRP